MIKGIEHVAIFANDTKKLSDWYVDVFGGKIAYDNGKGTYFVAFPDKSMIEFCTSTPEANELTGLEKPGIRHIAIAVDDFDGAVAKVKEAGVEIIKDADVNPSGIGTMFFRDPEGNILHFISRPEPLV